MPVEIIESEAGKPIESGAYRMRPDVYHADPCPHPSLSSSIAKILLEATPMHARHAHPRLNPDWRPEPPSKRLSLGSACHSMLLGAGASVVEIPFDSYRSNAAKDARDEAISQGKIPVLSDDFARVTEMVEAARKQLPVALLAPGDSEIAVFSDETPGGWSRAMLDWWSADRSLIADYKTLAGLASEEKFAKHLCDMGYDVQAAFYMRVVGSVYPELAGRLTFAFIAQEIEPPYALACYEIAESDLHVTNRKIDAAFDVWSLCLAGDKWPGYRRGIQRLLLPEYHTRKWLDSELREE